MAGLGACLEGDQVARMPKSGRLLWKRPHRCVHSSPVFAEFHSRPRSWAQELRSRRACLGTGTEAKTSVCFGTKKGQGWISGGARQARERSHLFLIRWNAGSGSISLNCPGSFVTSLATASGGRDKDCSRTRATTAWARFENRLEFLLSLQRLV